MYSLNVCFNALKRMLNMKAVFLMSLKGRDLICEVKFDETKRINFKEI